MFFFDPNNPESVKQAEAAHDRHHMEIDEASHRLMGDLLSLNPDQLITVGKIFSAISQAEDHAPRLASHYAALLYMHAHHRDGVCISCGRNHDEELKRATEGEPCA